MFPRPFKAYPPFQHPAILNIRRFRIPSLFCSFKPTELSALPWNNFLRWNVNSTREYFTLDKNTPHSLFSKPADKKYLAKEEPASALKLFTVAIRALPENPIIDDSVIKALHDMLLFSYSGDEGKRPYILEEMAGNGFFLESSASSETMKQLFQETIDFSLNRKLFYAFQAFGQPFRNLADAAIFCTGRIAGKRTLKAILDQINPCRRSLAYNNLIASFAIGKNQPDNGLFLLSLMERMLKMKLTPTSESLSTIIRAYVARCSRDTVSNKENFKTVFEMLRLSKRLALPLSPHAYHAILECSVSLAEVDPAFSAGVIKAAYELRNHRFLISEDLASSALWVISKATSLHTELPRGVWDDKSVFGVWVGLKGSALPKEKCAIALLTCASRCLIEPSHLARLVRTFIYLLKPTQTAASSESLAQLIGLCGLLKDIHEFLGEITSRGVPLTKKAFNLILSNLVASGNPSAAISYFELLTSPGKNKLVPAVTLDTTSIAIAFEASCVAKRPAMILSFFRSVFESGPPIVLNEVAYMSFLRGLSSLNDNAHVPFGWISSSLETVLLHSNLTNYTGPKDRIAAEVVSIYARFVCQSKGPVAIEAYGAMISKFDKLVRAPQLVMQVSLYVEMVKAMALAPGSSLIISDVRRIYTYMLSTNVRPNLAFFASAMDFLGSARDTKSLHFLFNFILSRFKSHRHSDPTPRIAIFNVFLKHCLVADDRVVQFLHAIHTSGAVPNHETLYNMLYKHYESNSPLSVLQNLLLLFSDLLAYAHEPSAKLVVSIPTVELVAKAFYKAGGISEMSRAVDFVLSMMDPSKPGTILPDSFYHFIINTALSTPDHTAVEVAVDWIKRLTLRPQTGSSRHILDASAHSLKSLDPLLLLSLPAEKARFVRTLINLDKREEKFIPSL